MCRKIDKVSVGGNPQKQWSEEATAFFYSLFFSVYNDGLISRPDIVRKLIHLVCSCRKVGNAAEMEIEILACFSLRQDIESYYEDEWSSYSCLAGAFCQNAASVQQNMCTMKRGLQGVPTSFKQKNHRRQKNREILLTFRHCKFSFNLTIFLCLFDVLIKTYWDTLYVGVPRK